MSEREDELELEALQRQLDDAFETTRPRRGFEDELWLRMQQRRPFGARVRDVLAGLAAGFREAPAVPLGALALVVIVAIGVGALGSGVFRQTGHNSAGAAMAPNAGSGSKSTDYYAGGQVPTPVLHPGLVDTQAPAVPGQGPEVALGQPSNVYYGPANLQWIGSFTTDNVTAPVLVYAEPTQQQLQAAVASIGPQQGVSVQARGSVSQLPREPVFIATEQGQGAPSGTDAVVMANTFLAAHNLVPSWPYTVAVLRTASVTRVVFQREVSLPDGGTAYLVDWKGDRYGTEVDIVGGTRSAVGPLPLALQSVSLPLVSNDVAVQMALSQPPDSAAAITPVPAVRLDQVELVYALAYANQRGFYEPAYLFSGTFTYNGQTYVKRVLVPLVAPNLRS